MRRTGTDALSAGLVLLAVALAANAVLGPLVAGVIDYHYGESMTAQGIGLDAVALVAAAPLAVVAAWLVHAGRVAGPVLAFPPAVLAAYMAPQYVVGPDYLGLPGDNERWVVLHLVMFLLGVVVAVLAWQRVERGRLRPASTASDRRRSWVLLGFAAFVLMRWLPLLVALARGDGAGAAWLDNPTAFLLIAFLDLGLVVPATVGAAIGLRRGADWARTAAYAVLGFIALVPLSVAAMAIAMVARGDPLASTAGAVGFTAVAAVAVVGVGVLYRPVLRPTTTHAVGSPAPPRVGHRG